MQKLRFIMQGKVSLLFLCIFLYACSDECENIDCISQEAFRFTIKSESGNEDLLFGNNPQLSADEVEVFYRRNGEEETIPTHTGTNSLSVWLIDDVNEYYVRALDQTDVVNVQFHRRSGGECCPTTTHIDEISVNGDVVQDEAGIIELLR